MNKIKIKYSLLLFLAACIWGIAFVAQSVGMDYMGPLTFNASRFLVGGIVLFPFALRQEHMQWNTFAKPEDRGKHLGITILGGLCCGAAICTASTFQQFGMLYTSVGKAGFITALYIVLVPVLGLFFRRKPNKQVWLCAIIALAGLYLLCINETMTLNWGDVLMFFCALVFSVHIMVIDYFSPKANGVTLSCIQFFVSGFISLTGALLFETTDISAILKGIIPVLYAGVMSCGVAYTLQIIGQKYVAPAVASLILSLESVVSVLAGWILLQEVLSGREVLGCILMFVAVVVVQLPEKKKRI